MRQAKITRVRPARGGWVLLDAIAGLIILAVIGFVFTVSLIKLGRAREHLAHSRAAARELEAAAMAWRETGVVPGDRVRVVNVGDGAWQEMSMREGKSGSVSVIVPAPGVAESREMEVRP